MALGDLDASGESPPTPVVNSFQNAGTSGEPPILWQELLRQARAGSPTAVGQLLDQCRGYLTVIIQQEIGDQIRAKVAPSDIVQESLVEAYRHFERFAGTTEQELLGWLRRTVLNNLADAVKRYRGTVCRAVDRERSLSADADQEGQLPELVADSALPLEKVIRVEEQQRLLNAIGQLPDRQRQVVILRNLEAKSFQEIGADLAISGDAARKLWERAIQRLTAELRPDDRSSSNL